MAKFRNVEIASVTGAAVLLGATSLLSRLIGLLRDRLFAHTFGAGPTLDAYYAAFRIPDLLYNLLVMGALSAGFIPVFLSVWEKEKEDAWRTVNLLLRYFFVTLSLLAGVLAYFAPKLVPILAPGFAEGELELAITLTRIMLISPIILGLSSIVSGVLQSLKIFLPYALAPIFYNVGIIVGVFFFLPRFGAAGLAYGVLLGAAFHLAIQLPSFVRSGFRYVHAFRPNRAVRSIALHMLPRTLSLGAHQMIFVAATMLASTLSTGNIAIFNFAMNLSAVPLGLIGISFATAAFPTLSASMARGEIEEFKKELMATARLMLFCILPATVIFLSLRAQIVRVVLGSGAFDWRATVDTADTMAAFAISLFAQCLVLLFVRAFFALHDTKTPLWVSVVTMVADIVFSVALLPTLGVAGLAGAFSLATMLQIVLLWLFLRKKIGTLHEMRLVNSLAKMSIAALLMTIVLQALKAPLASMVDMQTFWGVFTQGALAGIAGLFVYGVICRILKLEEFLRLQQGLKRRWLKIKNIPPKIPDLQSGE